MPTRRLACFSQASEPLWATVSQNTCSSRVVSSNEVLLSGGKRAGLNKRRLLFLPCIKPSSSRVEKQPSASSMSVWCRRNPRAHPSFTSPHEAHTPRQAGHSRDSRSLPAPALGPGLGQVVQQSASESNCLPLMLLEHLPQVSLLSTPELHQRLVASELLQRGHNHICRTAEQRQARLVPAKPAGAPPTAPGVTPPPWVALPPQRQAPT